MTDTGKKRKNFKQRLVTAVALIALVVTMLAVGGWPLALMVGVCLALALHEEYAAFAAKGHRPVRWPGYASLAASVPLLIYFSSTAFSTVLMAFSIAVLLCVMTRKEPDLQDVMVSALPLFSISLPGMCFFSVMTTEPRSLQLYLLVLIFAIPVLGDSMAYFVGSAVGGPKLCPRISPNKTIAGAIGGLAGSLAAAIVVHLGFTLAVPAAAFPPLWTIVLVGLVGGAAAQIGDLLASLVKRYCGVKDFGAIFPGHGGMMDRMDSIVFTAIIIYCFRNLIVG